MKKESDTDYLKKIAEYELEIEKNGIKSLAIEEIVDYREALEKKLSALNESVKSYQLLLAANLSFAALGAYKALHTINYILNKYSNVVPSNAELVNQYTIAATATYGFVALFNSFASGTAFSKIISQNQSKKEVEELIGLTETYSRVK